MRPARDADDYQADPHGRYLALRHALVFCARPSLWGFALWGRPSERDARALVRLLALELRPEVAPHASLVDVGRLEAADPRAFAHLARYLAANFATFESRVTRLALVRPPGVLGATVAGFYEVAGAPYPVRVFGELAAAAAWLRTRGVASELAAAVDAAIGTPPVVRELRAWLDHHLHDTNLLRAANGLACAPRSLQRALAKAGTTFQRELDAARVRCAQQLLATSDSTLTEIAYDVGCASPQHFSTVFRRVAGVTPSAWRARNRTPRRRRQRGRNHNG
jgi:AraC-like DNA-binding protein